MSDSDSIRTSKTLLAKLKDWKDGESWQEFFGLYWRLIQTTALKAGLTRPEAEEVLQEVMLAAAKRMPDFTYDPAKDSLKGWLLTVTRWKIGDQFRKRDISCPGAVQVRSHPSKDYGGRSESQTATVERIADTRCLELELIWDQEWHQHLLAAALDHIKRSVNPAHFEVYHLHVLRGLSVRETGRALGISAAAVYVAKHRVGRLLKRTIKCLKQEIQRRR